jgi:hypothetical protein
MATVTRTILVDDLDGTDNDVQTVRFSIDKHDYEIDLSAENAARLRGKLDKFVQAGHPLRESKRAVHRQAIDGTGSKEQTQAIRHWARENGHHVSERGRIPANVRAAFEAAH